MNIINLTKNEYELMKVLWDSNRPLAKHELLDECKDHEWSDSYLKKMLTGLSKKGAIEPVGKVHIAKKLSRLYAPVITEDEYNIAKYPVKSLKTIANLVDNVYNNSNKKGKEQLINELEQLIEGLKENDE